MIVGVPKEIKANENRIALVPAGAEALVSAGHEVIVEQSAGEGSGFPDSDYSAVGAKIEPDVDALWQRAEMIMKVKEPIAVEYPRMRPGQVLFTVLPLCRRRDAYARDPRAGSDRHRVRDGPASRRRASAVDPDVRSRGQNGRPVKAPSTSVGRMAVWVCFWVVSRVSCRRRSSSWGVESSGPTPRRSQRASGLT